MELLGKTVVVTGGGRGLGRAYCESLAEQGANVVAADIRDTGDTIKAVKSAGGHGSGVHLDVTDATSCSNMADAAIEAYGRIDSLINNAALYGDISGGRFDQIPDSQWDNVMNVNIKPSGTENYSSSQLLSPEMVPFVTKAHTTERKWGRR